MLVVWLKCIGPRDRSFITSAFFFWDFEKCGVQYYPHTSVPLLLCYSGRKLAWSKKFPPSNFNFFMEPCLKCHICGAVINEDDIYAALDAFDLDGEDSDDDLDDFEDLTAPDAKCPRLDA